MKETRFVEVSYPGFFFADISEMKVPKTLWDGSNGELAEHIAGKEKNAVAFRRIEYSPSEGKVYKDRGWVYFRGLVLKQKDVLSGEANRMHPDLVLNETAIGNIERNNVDVIWLKDYGKIWPYDSDDKFVSID